MDKLQLRGEIRSQIFHSLYTDLSTLNIFSEDDREYVRRMVDAKVDYLMECIDTHVKPYLSPEQTK